MKARYKIPLKKAEKEMAERVEHTKQLRKEEGRKFRDY